mgnify:CR=1 FL=1
MKKIESIELITTEDINGNSSESIIALANRMNELIVKFNALNEIVFKQLNKTEQKVKKEEVTDVNNND